MKITNLLILASATLLWTACSSDSKPQVKETKNDEEPIEMGIEDDGRGGEFDDYMVITDMSDSLVGANTLYYSKPDGESYQVYLKLDEESNIVRMNEQYTSAGSGSILNTFYYYRDGYKVATKEIYNKGTGDEEMFYERVSYYEKGKPIVTKIRSAQYEEYLEEENFKIIDPEDCSDERAKRALARGGEFATNFVGVITQDQINYIIVGEGKEGGFTTSLLVQQFTPLITQMLTSPDTFKGKAMDIEFEELPDGQGFTFQSLIDIKPATE